MRFTIKRKNFFDCIIMTIIMLQVMVFTWLDIADTIYYLVFILIAFAILKDYNYYRKSSDLIYIVLIIFYFLMNLIIIGGRISFFLGNLYKVLRGTLIFSYMFRLLIRKPDFIKNYIKMMCPVFNIYAIINVPILLLQLNGMYSLASRTTKGLGQHLRVDLISGTFGLFMTPALGIFSTFIFIYNLYYIKNWCKKSIYTKLFKLYNYLLLLFNLWISTQNDNKGFYIVFLLYLIAFYVASTNSSKQSVPAKRKNILGQLFGIAAIVIFFIIAFRFSYLHYQSFQTIVDRAVRKIESGFNHNTVVGGGERIGMVLYWLQSPRNWLMGFGLGKYRNGAGTLGFSHFGQADLGSYLCLGGLILILLLCLSIGTRIKKILNDKLLTLIIVLTYVFLLFYTRIYTRPSTQILTIYTFYLLWTVLNSSYKDDSTTEPTAVYLRNEKV